MTINGDYLWLENLTIEHATPEGLRVNTSATGTVLKTITALAAIVDLRGVNTLAEDMNVSHVIRQGTHPSECYDANPSFGVGECWNARHRAGLRSARGDSSSSGQIIRHARRPSLVEWRGDSGQNTLEHSRFWGFPNHTMAGRHGDRHPPQRRPERAGLDLFPAQSLRRPHRREQRVCQRCSLLGQQQGRGGMAPKSWRFRYNVVPAITYDDKTYPAVTADCNVLIPSSASSTFLMKVTGTDGRTGFEYGRSRTSTRTPLSKPTRSRSPHRNGPTEHCSGGT